MSDAFVLRIPTKTGVVTIPKVTNIINMVSNSVRGHTGAVGSMGPTGPTGNQGNQGSQGEQGTQGHTGPQGAIGPTGSQGIQGIIGFTGPTGGQGIQGLIGMTGPTGSQGVQGVVGSIGPTGPVGSQGIIGATGPIGTSIKIKDKCKVKTSTLLPSYVAEGSQVGKTLTASINSVLGLIDGVVMTLNDRILVDDSGTLTGADRGIYTVTDLGSVITKWELTRATDADENDEVETGMFVFVEEGLLGGNKGYALTTPDPITVDTTSLSFSLFSLSVNLENLTSFEEKETNTNQVWIDNSLIYRRVFDLDGLSDNSVLISSGTVDVLVKTGGVTLTGGSTYRSVPHNDGTLYGYIEIVSGEVRLRVNTTQSSDCYIWIEYTKV